MEVHFTWTCKRKERNWSFDGSYANHYTVDIDIQQLDGEPLGAQESTEWMCWVSPATHCDYARMLMLLPALS